MAFAYDTLIAVPSGFVAIQSIAVGDQVLAAWLSAPSVGFAWKDTPVTFSNGESGEILEMIYIVHDGGDLVCTPIQPLMLADGRLTTASQLRLGDKLVGKEGQGFAVKLVNVGKYQGGVQNIATGFEPAVSEDGHLLLAGGVIAGDLWLEQRGDAVRKSARQ